MFCFHFIQFESRLWRLIFYVHRVPSPFLFMKQHTHFTIKTLALNLFVRQRGLLQLDTRTHIVVCGIDGHEFRSSISSNHKFSFNAILSSAMVAASLLPLSSSKHYQFPFFYVSRDFAEHTHFFPHFMQSK